MRQRWTDVHAPSAGSTGHWLTDVSLRRYCGRRDCGCDYQMTVCLLDDNQEVLQEFKPEPVTLDPDSDDCSWKQVGLHGGGGPEGGWGATLP